MVPALTQAIHPVWIWIQTEERFHQIAQILLRMVQRLVGTMRLFTFQGIIAFFCVFGWSGLAFTRVLASSFLSMALAIMLGFLFMFLVALLIRALSKLADDGSVSIVSTLGYSGTVYLTVPSKGNGHGKVNITIGGHFNEYDAITDSSVPLPTGSRVRIIDVRGDAVLVEPEQ